MVNLRRKIPDMSFLNVGTAAFDTIHTPRGSADWVVGGAAMYISWASSYLTDKVQMVSIVGEDFPEDELAALRNRGVQTDGVLRVEGAKSFYWAGKYHDNMIQRDTLTTDLNVLADFDPDLPSDYKEAHYVLLGNLTPDVQIDVLSQISNRPKMVAMDTMNFWIDSAWDRLQEAIRMVDILIINDDEARQMTNEHSLVQAAAKIMDMGPTYALIKKGEHGALLFSSDHVFYAPGLPLQEVVDPTGAGDTFAGGFMGHIASSNDLSFDNMRKAVIYGSVLASFCVEDFGLNRLKSLSGDDISQRYDQFKDLVRFD